MKKKELFLACLVIPVVWGIVLVKAGRVCADDLPEANPDALWHYITKESPYTNWDFWPDHQGMQAGRAPHGPLHKVYVNSLALKSSGVPLQAGSIQVKENFGKDRELKAVTVMYKIPGYNPRDGDWYWAKYTPEGKSDVSGKPRGCIGCHGTRASNDFVIVHDLR